MSNNKKIKNQDTEVLLNRIKSLSNIQIQDLCEEIEFKLKNKLFDEFTKNSLEALIEYGKLTILNRAFPKVEDGLKPVHRRILVSMNDLHLTPTSAFKKSARITGNCIGIYHPHGDTSVYDAMVRMAQPFSMKEELVIGQGNFGTVEGDSAASSRYTEATVSKVGYSFFKDLEKNVVPFIDNYDETTKEPLVLPVKFPNLLINGTQGIAVGMASKIPTHNPIEVLNATKYVIEKIKAKEAPVIEELIEILPGPDFPTGGIIYNTEEMKNAFLTGETKIKLRAKYELEKRKNKESLVITEIPYLVKLPTIFNKLQEIANNKKEEAAYEIFKKSISDIRNESNKNGLRIVIDLKSGVDSDILWNQLIKVCALDETVSYLNNIIDIDGKPKIMGILDILNSFIKFRKGVILKKYEFIKKETEDKLELIEGFIKALDIIDEIIKIIRNSESDEESTITIQNLGFTERQTKAILNMRLGRLSKLEGKILFEEKESLEKIINNANKMIKSDTLKYNEMIEDLEESEKLFKNKKRLTEINNSLSGITHEDLIKKEDCVLYLTNIGYLRREAISDLNKQNRNTRGKKKFELTENDFIVQSFNTDSHSTLLFITKKGLVFGTKAFNIPDRDKGRFVAHLFDIPEGDKLIKVLEAKDLNDNIDLILSTKKGFIKRTKLSEYTGALRKSGVIGINLSDNDEVRYAGVIESEEGEALLINSDGKIIRFGLEEVPCVGRNSRGVIGMRFDEGEVLDGLVGNISEESVLLTVGDNGTIKASSLNEYKKQKRAGKGVFAMKTNDKTGGLIKAILINELEGQDLIITSKSGISNRIPLKDIKLQSRNTSGIKAMKLDKKDIIVDAFPVPELIKEEEES